jgi:hypothetical protein
MRKQRILRLLIFPGRFVRAHKWGENAIKALEAFSDRESPVLGWR